MLRRRWWLILAATGVLLSGCSGSTGADEYAANASSTPSASGPGRVIGSVRYATNDIGGGWKRHTSDVHTSGQGAGLPLIVVFHGGAKSSRDAPYRLLAEDLVSRGAVVVSVNWTDTLPGDLLAKGEPVDAIVTRERQTVDEMACAVDFAVSQAAQYGADPSRLFLLGHSAGANMTSMLGLGSHNPFPGCLSPDVTWAPRGLVLWEGDWLAAAPVGWDDFGDDLGSRVLPTVAPWELLATAPDVPVVLAVSDTGRQSMVTCDATAWMPRRDPNGTLSARLDSLGAMDDKCIDVGEEADLLADAMDEQGIPATVLALTDPDTSHEYLAPSDQTLMADKIMDLTEG